MKNWKEETGHALEALRRLIRDSDLSQRKVEDRAGFSRGYVSQLLARNLDLKLWHVLAILEVLGKSPGEFFGDVYPAPPGGALARFQRSSQPLTAEVDEVLGRLYRFGVESLDELRDRLARCEEAVEQLEDRGILASPERRRSEG